MTANQPETRPIAVYTIILALISLMSVYFATETRKGAETWAARAKASPSPPMQTTRRR